MEPDGTEGNHWVPVDSVGFFDITDADANPPSIYGRRIKLDAFEADGDDIQLDDRRSDSLHYKISKDANGKIQIMPPGGGSGLSVKESDLYEERIAQVETMPTVTINKQNYYVCSQGAP